MKKLEIALAVALALAIVAAALARIFSSKLRSEMADSLNVPAWFLIAVGIVEIVLAIDLLLPRFRILGGIGVGATMVGATIFNLLGEDVGDAKPGQAVPLTILLALAAFVTAWLAADRPRDFGSLIATARNQITGQLSKVADTAADLA